VESFFVGGIDLATTIEMGEMRSDQIDIALLMNSLCRMIECLYRVARLFESLSLLRDMFADITVACLIVLVGCLVCVVMRLYLFHQQGEFCQSMGFDLY
jgi:hypothetical protein